MRNGAAGRRVWGFSSTFATSNGLPSSPVASERAEASSRTTTRLRRGLSVRAEVAPLRDAVSVHRCQLRLERTGVECAQDVPVRRRHKSHALALTVDDQPGRDRLDTSRGESRHHLLPENRRDLEAVEPVENPPGLLRVDEALVDLARLVERAHDRVLRDLVEDHPLDGDLRLQDFAQMPRDRFALAILVRREQQLVGLLQLALEVGDDALLVGVDDVVGLELVIDVDTELAVGRARLRRNVRCALRQVADVADAGFDRVVVAEVAGDGPRFRGGLDDDEASGHGATP